MQSLALTRATLAGATLILTACGGPLITERTDENGLTALMRAARAPDTTLLVRLIAKHADVSAQVPPRDLREGMDFFSQMQELPRATVGFTPLHFAVQSRRLDNARLLIANGANPMLSSRSGHSPLDFAVRNDDVDMTRLLARSGGRPSPQLAGQVVSTKAPALVAALYENGGEPNQVAPLPGQPGFRPLLVIAAERSEPAIVRTLLAAGAKVNARDVFGWSALRWAHEAKSRKLPGATEIIAMLDSAGAHDDAGLKALDLAHAVNRTDLAAVRAALRSGANPNSRDEKGISPLIHAASRGDARIAQALIDGGAAVNHAPSYGASPLTAAIEKGDVSMARVLIDAGARGDRRDGLGREPLWLTAMHRRTEIAALILADSTIHLSPFNVAEAAGRGDSAQVHLMLDHGADVNFRDGHMLFSAARGCHERDNSPVIRLLLARGARPGRGAYGSVLHVAAERCVPDVVTLLIQHGAPMNGQDFGGATPLMYAARRGKVDNVRALIAAGADVNAMDHRGVTALARARTSEMRQALVAAGAVQMGPLERTGVHSVQSLFGLRR